MNPNFKEKLRKILALTTSPVEGEAQAAAAMLARLLEQHNLDLADLEQKGAAKPGVREDSHDLGKAAFKWKLTLAEEIADYYFCWPMIDRVRNTVAFVGRPDNVESLKMLYDWLIDQIKRFGSVERKAYILETGEHIDPLRWQTGFGEGAAKRLGERLEEMRKKESSEAGTALVLSVHSELSDYLEQKKGFRIDGQKTKRQMEREEEWRKYDEEVEKGRLRLEKLKETDLEAYYAECPWDTPEERDKEARRIAELRKREQRNANRRKGPQRRFESWTEFDKRVQKEKAKISGSNAANKINLTPFISGGKEKKAIGG